MNRFTKVSHKNGQNGAVLFVSLIMLILLTLIGVTGSQVTGLEEKMAGNNRDQNIAFQSAEAALRAGEARIEAIWNSGNGSIQAFCDGTAGLFHANGIAGCDGGGCATACPAPDEETASTWTDNSKSISVATGSTLVENQPRYFITYVNYSDDGASPPVVTNYYFTITARGTGGQDTSQVVLRSYYGGSTSFLP